MQRLRMSSHHWWCVLVLLLAVESSGQQAGSAGGEAGGNQPVVTPQQTTPKRPTTPQKPGIASTTNIPIVTKPEVPLSTTRKAFVTSQSTVKLTTKGITLPTPKFLPRETTTTSTAKAPEDRTPRDPNNIPRSTTPTPRTTTTKEPKPNGATTITSSSAYSLLLAFSVTSLFVLRDILV